MRRSPLPALLFLAALALPAVAQDSLVGLEVRSPDRDQVLGEVLEVQGGAAIIQLESQDQPVAVPVERLQRSGNKLTLPMSEGELAELPPAATETPASPGEPAQLPMGGTTPGWGAQQGGWTQGQQEQGEGR